MIQKSGGERRRGASRVALGRLIAKQSVGQRLKSRPPYNFAYPTGVRSRTVNFAAAAALAVQAVVVGLLLAGVRPVLLAVTADFGGGIHLASVNLGIAAVVLLAFSAVSHASAAIWRGRLIRWVEWSQVSAVIVFVLAQLNGVQDVAALVSLYALTAAASFFLVLHEQGSGSTWPYVFGAAVAIVPWGVIAFYQLGALVVGADPGPFVRAITLALLILTIAYWRGARIAITSRRPAIASRVHTLVIVLSLSILAWSVFAASLLQVA